LNHRGRNLTAKHTKDTKRNFRHGWHELARIESVKIREIRVLGLFMPRNLLALERSYTAYCWDA
jgi:hypothetical protein